MPTKMEITAMIQNTMLKLQLLKPPLLVTVNLLVSLLSLKKFWLIKIVNAKHGLKELQVNAKRTLSICFQIALNHAKLIWMEDLLLSLKKL